MINKKANNNGITIIELMLTLGIIAMVIQVVYSIFFVGNKSFKIGKDIGFAQQDVRLTGDFITKELKNAEFITNESTHTNLIYPYYSLKVINDNLVKTTYNDVTSITNKEIFSNIEKIDFSIIDNEVLDDGTVISGLLRINILANENGQKEELAFQINLENWYRMTPKPLGSIEQESIYYSKHK